MLKKGKGSVDNFTDAVGKKYLPGDIVDLPTTYEGEAWLERVDKPKKAAVAVPGKVEVVPDVKTIPFELENKKKAK